MNNGDVQEDSELQEQLETEILGQGDAFLNDDEEAPGDEGGSKNEDAAVHKAHALVFQEYKPLKTTYGKQHQAAIVESYAMASVVPPDVWYTPLLPSHLRCNALHPLCHRCCHPQCPSPF